MIEIKIAIESGNMIKLFTDLNLMLKAHPNAKIDMSDGETTYKRE